MINPLLNSHQLERIVEKQSLLRDLEASGLTKKAFAQQRGISRATLYRDIARREASGFSGLIDKRTQKTKTGVKLENKATEFILDYLVSRPQAPITAIASALHEAAHQNGWDAPSYDKIRRFRQSISPDVLLQFAQGRKARVETSALTVTRTVEAVNELWQTDFSEIPLWTFDPVRGPELFKPWIVSTICCASRVVPGALVCPAVNAAEILKCWKKAMLPKGVPTYPFYGVPTRLSLDNHQVHKGDALESLYLLGVEPHFIPNDSPEANGKQERWFKTLLTRLISHLDGFADQYRGLQKAKQKTIPYPLLQTLIDEFILNYHLTEHSTLGTTPWLAWHQRLATAQGLMVPGEAVNKNLRLSRPVLVSSTGVRVDNRSFTSPFLEGLVGKEVTVRVQPEGAHDFVLVYDHGVYLGEAKEQIDSELSEQITTSRLERTIAIQELAKTIRERKAQKSETPPTPPSPPCPPLTLPPDVMEEINKRLIIPNLFSIETPTE